MADDDPSNPSPSAFAVVYDVAASWEAHATTTPAPDVDAPGLILHAAGPTDDGIRTIDIWESETAWNHHRLAVASREQLPSAAQAAVLRQLRVRELLHPDPATAEPHRAHPSPE
jgi:hypothetical protein